MMVSSDELDNIRPVVVDVRIESWGDVWTARQGLIEPSAIRSIDVNDALVDTNHIRLGLPRSLIDHLGLTGQVTELFPVWLTILGRSCTMEVEEVPDNAPVVVGRAALLSLDLVIDSQRRTLTSNPLHGGEQILEMFSCV